MTFYSRPWNRVNKTPFCPSHLYLSDVRSIHEKMVKRCCWGTCNTDSRFPDRLEGGILFIPFPKPGRNLEKGRRWIRLCGRPHSQLNEAMLHDRGKAKHLFVCSKHFMDGAPSEKFPDPIPALPHDRITPSRKRPAQRSLNPAISSSKRRKILAEIESSSNEVNNQETSSSAPDQINQEDSRPHEAYAEEQKFTDSLEILAIVAENERLKQNNSTLSASYAKIIIENEDLHRKLAACGEKKKESVDPSMSCKTLKSSDYQYYTGFSEERFQNVFRFLVPEGCSEPFTWTKTVSGVRNINLQDQLLLVMMKLRQNFDFVHLGRLFCLSSQDCSTLFFNWISFMFYRLGSLVIWPHRDIIIQKMPSTFKIDFPNTLVIIDGTELKIQRPSALNRQSQCYSDYKSCTTLKGLVGVDPRGSVIFSSMLFSGSISDKDITEQSGFLRLLQDLKSQGKINAGDGVLADKGFTIEDEIRKLGLHLNIPPFASSGSQMKAHDVSKTIKIAKHRVHVERAIARIKQFKILSNKINLSMFSCINQIWLTCCLLTNFMPYLIQDESKDN